jgi:chromatin segregation and condensation protein Rec8/ScpA/Scc1 (kleisin family)
MDGSTPERELRCRTALASTFVAGLELAREGAVQLGQERAWQAVIVQDAKVSIGTCSA